MKRVRSRQERIASTLIVVFTTGSFRVLVTRPRTQASSLAKLLEAAGAIPILIPTIEIVPPSSYRALDHAITSAQDYDWVLFTSANAVEVFAQRAAAIGLWEKPRRIAVIGPATADAVRMALKLPVDRMPARYVAEAMVESLRYEAPNSSMLLVRAAVARDVLPAGLKALGARVTIVSAYRKVVPEASIEEIRELFAKDAPDAITFTSASTAQNLHALLEAAALKIPEGIVLASIGPVTSEAMREFGMEPTVEAKQATIASLADALLGSLRERSGGDGRLSVKRL